MAKKAYTYPLEPPALTPAHLLADPPARTPLADRQTTITIHSDGEVTLDTNDPNIVRPIAGAVSQGKETWEPALIEGDEGRQTHWVLKGDSSLISIRANKFKRPGVIKNLKKEKVKDDVKKEEPPESRAPTAPATRWDGFEF